MNYSWYLFKNTLKNIWKICEKIWKVIYLLFTWFQVIKSKLFIALHYITLHYTQCNCIGHLFVISHNMKVISSYFASLYSTFNLNDYVWQSFLIFMAHGGSLPLLYYALFFSVPRLHSKMLCLSNITCFLDAVSWGCYSRTWSDPWVLSYTFNSPGHLPSPQINAASVHGALMLLLSSDALGARPVVSEPPTALRTL